MSADKEDFDGIFRELKPMFRMYWKIAAGLLLIGIGGLAFLIWLVKVLFFGETE